MGGRGTAKGAISAGKLQLRQPFTGLYNEDEMARFIHAESIRIADTLSPEQQSVINEYTTTTGANYVNDLLHRNTNEAANDDFYIALNKIIENYEMPRTIRMHRMVEDPALRARIAAGNLHRGDIIQLNGMQSMSARREVIKEFSGNISLEITVPKGTKGVMPISAMSHLPEEAEALGIHQLAYQVRAVTGHTGDYGEDKLIVTVIPAPD